MPNCPSAAFELCGDGEDSWESLALQGDPTSQSERKSILNIHWKDWCWSWNSNTLATYVKNWFIGKDPDAGKDWRHEEKGTTEYEMAGWYHRLKGHEFGWTPGAGDGQGGLACCSPWGCKESDTTEWLNWTEDATSFPTLWPLYSLHLWCFVLKSPSHKWAYSQAKV